MTFVSWFKKALAYLLFLILILWICGYVGFLAHIETLKPQNPGQKTDAIIVLTGGSLRINTGLGLFASHMSPKLLITGVHPSVNENAIRAMWKGKTSLPACCITLGHDAATTIGNALEAQKWIKENHIKSARLVTSAYHMPRSMLEFNSILPSTNIKILLHPVVQKEHLHMQTPLRYMHVTFYEYNKTLIRWCMLAIL